MVELARGESCAACPTCIMDTALPLLGYVVTVTSLACYAVHKPYRQSETCSPIGDVVLVTGGAGYVGSHTVLELLLLGYEVVVVDNLVNAVAGAGGEKPVSLQRVEKITGKPIHFHNVDLRNRSDLSAVFKKYHVRSVLHFAALKAVGESIDKPIDYYNNNICGTISLLEVMRSHRVNQMVFSSSATVYGSTSNLPIPESEPTGRGITNPYGRSKYFIEEMLKDIAASDPAMQITLLRYFNPVGAHSSGMIGEDPRGTPNNLMPYISQVAVGRRSHLNVYGSSYPTIDGTGVRDYIHVVDLARGHTAALRHMVSGCVTYNLGTGQGYSVLQVVAAFRRVSGKPIPVKVVAPRPGDLAAVYADCRLAERQLKWKASLSLDDMVGSAWNWQQNNVHGYSNVSESH